LPTLGMDEVSQSAEWTRRASMSMEG